MVRYLTGIIAVVIAIGAVAFTKPTSKTVKTNPRFTNTYFQFVGTTNSQEGDVTKWNSISLLTYNALPCTLAHDGCKLIATSTQQVSGITRPANIYLVSGTFDPTTGANVSEVGNLSNTR